MFAGFSAHGIENSYPPQLYLVADIFFQQHDRADVV